MYILSLMCVLMSNYVLKVCVRVALVAFEVYFNEVQLAVNCYCIFYTHAQVVGSR